jgi:transposase
MSGESGVVGRRSREETARLAGLYRSSGMGRGEFCRSHGLSLSTLARHLKKRQDRPPQRTGDEGGKPGRLVEVQLSSGATPVGASKRPGILTVLLSNGRRVEVDRGFDAATLGQLVTILERL